MPFKSLATDENFSVIAPETISPGAQLRVEKRKGRSEYDGIVEVVLDIIEKSHIDPDTREVTPHYLVQVGGSFISVVMYFCDVEPRSVSSGKKQCC